MKKDDEAKKSTEAPKFDKTFTKRNTQNLMLKLGTRLKSLQIKPDRGEDSLGEAEQSSSRQSRNSQAAIAEAKPPREKRQGISRSFANLVSWHSLAKEKEQAIFATG